MSGGSYEYIYERVEELCKGQMFDAELNELIGDLCDVLHDVEWWQSGDMSEEEYRDTVKKFKAKWLHGDREVRLKGYIDAQVGQVKRALYALVGVEEGVDE